MYVAVSYNFVRVLLIRVEVQDSMNSPARITKDVKHTVFMLNDNILPPIFIIYNVQRDRLINLA